MKTAQQLYNERYERLAKTLAHEKTDRTPVVLMEDAKAADHMGVKLSEYITTIKVSNKVMIDYLKDLGDVDGIDQPFSAALNFPMVFMSGIKLPGRELPENMLWQLDEKEVMTPDDYDTIINNGWNSFRADYLPNRVNYDMQKTLKDLEYAGQATKNIEDAGYVVYAPVVHTLVNEALSGGRSMAKFMRDLYKMPDKVEATLEVIQKEEMEVLRQQIRAAKPLTVFVSPSRGASEFFAPKLWERFVWKYMKEVGDIIIEEGSIVNFHCDGNWERDLEYFNEFPKGKCVFESDGITDIYKLKEKIGDTVCIKGDVPSGTMVLGTPDEVYEYSSKLIKDMGTGFILSNGCAMPPNAKSENIRAMISAATGK